MPSSSARASAPSVYDPEIGTGDDERFAACELPELDDERRESWREAIESGTCLHCKGELGAFAAPEDGPFCCRGCRSVYELIHGTGLARYYELQSGRQAPAARLRTGSFAWLERVLDEEEIRGDAPFRLCLDIQGVHCAACIWLLEELFRREAGGLDLTINPTLGKVDLVWDPRRGDLRHYLREVEKFGYLLGPSRKGPARRSSGLLVRMATTIALALNVMMFSVSYYLGLAPEDGAIFVVFGALNFALATAAVIVGGHVFFKGALAALMRRMAHLDLPIAMGIALAYGGSVYAYFSQGPRAAYFDSLTIFIALMLVGRWAQEHILERNRNALLDTAGADMLTTKRRREGTLEAVAAPGVEAGDELWIAPGDLVPVESILLRQPAVISLDWITGESEALPHQPGDTIPAGAFNASDRGFAVASVQSFADSKLHDLLRMQPGSSEAFRPRWWTWVGGLYVAAVLTLAATGFFVWAPTDMRRALEVTIAILVVTCPCALGLATPLAHELLHAALRRRGVFIRSQDFFDRALAIRKVLLDKTGTLTMGDLMLDTVSRKSLWRLAESERLLLWNMTVRSNHPVSRALATALGGPSQAADSERAGGLRLEIESESVRETPGKGLELQLDGALYRLGREDFARNTAAGDEAYGSSDGSTLFTVNGEVIAAFTFSERLKSDAASEVAWLGEDGFETYLLSGDTAAKVEKVRLALGVEPERAYGDLDPENKASVVSRLDDTDTLMVGDGLNDSPSFEAALCTATPAVDRPVLPGKADFYFLGDGVAAIRKALGAARRLRRVVKANLVVAALYNLGAVGLCMAGLVTPVVAAVLMPLSSVAIVSLTTYRLSGRRLTWMS